jgi:sugar O-acyltransferase (sialic acid O-acetyltransferase NeuD family)
MAGRISERTERAIRRVLDGHTPTSSARAEDIDPSTLFRALRRRREEGPVTQGRIVIIGAGSLGRELMQWIRLDGRTEEIAFLDDGAAGHAMGIGNLASYERKPGDQVLIAIADPAGREKVAEQLASMATFVSGLATAGDCAIGAGSLLMPYCLVSADARLGIGTILNTYASVGHDVELGDFCTLSSHVDLCGRVKIGARVFFGSGARALPGVTIGDGAVIGAGAVVVKDVAAGATVFGNPARQVA